jgi:hypothetical protein
MKNELKTHFEENFTTSSYSVRIGRAWCSRKLVKYVQWCLPHCIEPVPLENFLNMAVCSYGSKLYTVSGARERENFS